MSDVDPRTEKVRCEPHLNLHFHEISTNLIVFEKYINPKHISICMNTWRGCIKTGSVYGLLHLVVAMLNLSSSLLNS